MGILIADEFNRCRCVRRRWVTSWTLSLHKPLWLLVHARYDLFDILLFAIMLCDVCYWIWSSATTRWWATRWINVLSSTPWSHFFSKRPKTLQPEGTLGNWWRSIVTVIHVCTSFPRGSSIDGINLQEDVDVQSINCFKNRLEKRRTRQMDFFKDL